MSKASKNVKAQVVQAMEVQIKRNLDLLKVAKDPNVIRELTEEVEYYYTKLEEMKGLGKGNIDYEPYVKVVGGLAGILLILNYEKTEILNSKALTFAQRMLGL